MRMFSSFYTYFMAGLRYGHMRWWLKRWWKFRKMITIQVTILHRDGRKEVRLEHFSKV